jgi:hypothetical protein
MKPRIKKIITHCGHCHTCSTKLRQALDGEEWCPKCGEYRRYQSHGWNTVSGEESNCTPITTMSHMHDKQN